MKYAVNHKGRNDWISDVYSRYHIETGLIKKNTYYIKGMDLNKDNFVIKYFLEQEGIERYIQFNLTDKTSVTAPIKAFKFPYNVLLAFLLHVKTLRNTSSKVPESTRLYLEALGKRYNLDVVGFKMFYTIEDLDTSIVFDYTDAMKTGNIDKVHFTFNCEDGNYFAILPHELLGALIAFINKLVSLTKPELEDEKR